MKDENNDKNVKSFIFDAENCVLILYKTKQIIYVNTLNEFSCFSNKKLQLSMSFSIFFPQFPHVLIHFLGAFRSIVSEILYTLHALPTF